MIKGLKFKVAHISDKKVFSVKNTTLGVLAILVEGFGRLKMSENNAGVE
jgi:hypothetical protein